LLKLLKFMTSLFQRISNYFIKALVFYLCVSFAYIVCAMDIQTEYHGPGGGGWVECLAVSPVNSEVVYAGSDVGGIFKTTDGGKSWQPSSKGLKNDFVRDVIIDPNNADIIYAATLGGVHKSIDGGNTWAVMRNGFPQVSDYDFSAPINTLAFDPKNTEIIYAGIGNRNTLGKGQIYKSSDSGKYWSLLNKKNEISADAVIHSICIDGAKSEIIYLGTNRGVYKSVDGGLHWQPKNNGFPHYDVRKIAISNAKPNTLYVTLWSSPATPQWQGGVYISEDGGDSWRPINTGLSNFSAGALDTDTGISSEETSNYYAIDITNDNPRVVYVAAACSKGGGLYKTVDGGKNWTNVTEMKNIKDYGWLTHWGLGVTCFAIAPSNNSIIYVGSSGHVFKTQDAGARWQQVYTKSTGGNTYSGRGLENTCVRSITIDDATGAMYVGFFDIGLFKSLDGGNTFERIVQGMDYQNNTFTVLIDPFDKRRLYAGVGEWSVNKGSLCISHDAGKNWKAVGKDSGLPDGRVKFICVEAKNSKSNSIYASVDEKGIFKSNDLGITWESVRTSNLFKNVRGMFIVQGEKPLLYVATAKDKEQTGGIYRSKDQGNTWEKIVSTIDLPNIQSFIKDPVNAMVMYVATREYVDEGTGQRTEGGFYKTSDAGLHWERLFKDSFIQAAVVDKNNPKILYISCSDHNYHDYSRGKGVFVSFDGGSTWQKMSDENASLRIDALSLSEKFPGVLFCASAGDRKSVV
jgi:photosystem II stability/assembly factor-like uncharacterized protein